MLVWVGNLVCDGVCELGGDFFLLTGGGEAGSSPAWLLVNDVLGERIMRLWSLHPVYLDRQGLLACWREGLGAMKALRAWEQGGGVWLSESSPVGEIQEERLTGNVIAYIYE